MWYGGEFVVWEWKIMLLFDWVLLKCYQYLYVVYNMVKLLWKKLKFILELLRVGVRVNVIRMVLFGIIFFYEKIFLMVMSLWDDLCVQYSFCFVLVIECYGKLGEVVYGFFKDFGLCDGVVVSSVGYDVYNIIVVGLNEVDMQLVVEMLRNL